jgi:hypothetical protein
MLNFNVNLFLTTKNVAYVFHTNSQLQVFNS